MATPSTQSWSDITRAAISCTRAVFMPVSQANFRPALVPHCEKLRITRCQFVNLPERTEGRWGEVLTAAKMAMCRWLYPVVVARIEFLEWTPENRLGHRRFAGMTSALGMANNIQK